MKELYERTELDITVFQTEDVIATSGPDNPIEEPTPQGRYMMPLR